MQGAFSTILGVVGMLFAPSSSYLIFFKMIFIVICLGLVHSLVLVPVLLQLLLDTQSYLRQGGRQQNIFNSVLVPTYSPSQCTTLRNTLSPLKWL
jgi:hypothetical protein